MSFKSIDRILSALEQQEWQNQPFQILLKCWPEVVGKVVAAHTRPTSIQRDILWVATSSSSWAQNLVFERPRILQKLNPQLPTPLVDIRFSTAQWQSSKESTLANLNNPNPHLGREHPSFIRDTPQIPKNPDSPDSNNPNATFQHWAKVMQARLQNLPLCPQCNCPTPAGELQRWTICSFCAAKHWQSTHVKNDTH